MTTALLDDVRGCTKCEGAKAPFVRDDTGAFFRFPPTIGAAGVMPLLFVGINPRVSASNHAFHAELAANRTAFVRLSHNRVGTHPYIGPVGIERHYTVHVEIASRLFPGSAFEEVAAVTEVHLCASETMTGLSSARRHCVDRYFVQILEQVQPKVVFALGIYVRDTLLALFGGTTNHIVARFGAGSAPIITVPHPNSRVEKLEPRARAIRQAEAVLTATGPWA